MKIKTRKRLERRKEGRGDGKGRKSRNYRKNG